MTNSSVESAVLGLCMSESNNLSRVIALGISATSFADNANREIFAAMLQAEREGRPFDLASLALAVPQHVGLLTETYSDAPISQEVSHYALELIEESWAKDARKALMDLQWKLEMRAPFQPSTVLRKEIGQTLTRVMTETGKNQGAKHISTVIETMLEEIEHQVVMRRDGKPIGIPTGFKVLDLAIGGGFGPGSVNVAAARTGKGKTALALNFLRTASDAGYMAAYFTVEMIDRELAKRLISLEGRVHGTKLRVGDLDDQEMDRVAYACRKLHNAPIWIDDTTGASFEALEFSVQRMTRQGDLKLIVVDYVQQFHLAGRWSSTLQMITAVSHRLKQLAIKYKLAVICLAQLNREAERGEGKPDLWHIKDSGAIEQDADLAMLLHEEGDERKIYVAKNRHGKDRFDFPVTANLQFSQFKDVEGGSI